MTRSHDAPVRRPGRTTLGAVLVVAAAAVVATTGAVSASARVPARMRLRIDGPGRYGNQPLEGVLAWYAQGLTIPSRLGHDHACQLVGGSGGRRECEAPWYDPLCVSFLGPDESAFLCGVDAADDALSIHTERTVRIQFRVVAPDGSPLPVRTRAGVLVHGSRHVHPVGGFVEPDGSWNVGLPVSVASDPRTEIWALADGWPELVAPLPAGAAAGPVTVPLPGGRMVRGRIEGVGNAVDVLVPPSASHRSVPVGPHGRFAHRVLPGTRAVIVHAKDFVPVRIEAPECDDDLDFGVLRPVRGQPVRVSVKVRRGTPARSAQVTLTDGDGVCTEASLLSGSRYLAHVGPGPHSLRVLVSGKYDGALVRRSVVRTGVTSGGPDIEVVFPPALTLWFVDPDGRPVAVETVSVGVTPEGKAEAEPVQLHGFVPIPDDPFATSAQVDAPGPGRVAVVVRTPGHHPARVETTIAADGSGAASVVLRPR